MKKIIVKQDIQELGLKEGNILLYNSISNNYYFSSIDEREDKSDSYESYSYSKSHITLSKVMVEKLLSEKKVEYYEHINKNKEFEKIEQALKDLEQRLNKLIENHEV